jgi:hypothetical protein
MLRRRGVVPDEMRLIDHGPLVDLPSLDYQELVSPAAFGLVLVQLAGVIEHPASPLALGSVFA